MAVDWGKVAEDYARSTLDLDALHTYARKAAEQLVAAGVGFNGFTDVVALAGGRRRGWWSRVFGDDSSLDDRHLGFWVLVETGSSSFHKDRKKTHYPKMGSMGGFSLQHDYGHQLRQQWVLLADGQLASYTSHGRTGMARAHQESPPSWELMDADAVLLLDHKVPTTIGPTTTGPVPGTPSGRR